MADKTAKNTNEYNRIYQNKLYDVASVYDHIIRIRQRYLNDIKGRLLDHGFGNGVISSYFSKEGFDVYGIETTNATRDILIERASQMGLNPENFHIISSDAKIFPFDAGFLSAIVSNQVLYFIQDRNHINDTVKEFFRILKAGGKIVCTVMAENNSYFIDYGVPPVPESGIVHVNVTGRIERNFHLYRFRDKDDLLKTFSEAGFIIDDLGYFDYKLLDVSCAKHYIVLAHKP